MTSICPNNTKNGPFLNKMLIQTMLYTSPSRGYFTWCTHTGKGFLFTLAPAGISLSHSWFLFMQSMKS